MRSIAFALSCCVLAACLHWLPYRNADERVWSDDIEGVDPDRVPIAVRWDHDAWGHFHSEAIRLAIKEFPCGMFFEDTDDSPPAKFTVTILNNYTGAVSCNGDLAINELTAAGVARKCSDTRGEIWVAETGPDRWNVTQSFLLIQHELGHVAGLGHDRYYGSGETIVSVMTPDVLNFGFDRPGLDKFVPMLTDKDRKALTNRYCKEH